jgi:pectate lyase
MNILKPQNLHIQELENKYLVHIKEDEKINYCNFENEECNNIKLYEIEFEHCKFNNICMQNGTLEKIIANRLQFFNLSIIYPADEFRNFS